MDGEVMWTTDTSSDRTINVTGIAAPSGPRVLRIVSVGPVGSSADLNFIFEPDVVGNAGTYAVSAEANRIVADFGPPSVGAGKFGLLVYDTVLSRWRGLKAAT